jgi:DNA mismatch endonuclease (patch repair protein)
MTYSPAPSSEEASRRMRATGRRDTAPELKIRSELHRHGLRYFVDKRPLAGVNRRADLLFPRERIAVFVDGCSWHGCPVHSTAPKANADFWRNKIRANRVRDLDTNALLRTSGWTVLRFWEHEDALAAAAAIEGEVLRSRSRTPEPE